MTSYINSMHPHTECWHTSIRLDLTQIRLHFRNNNDNFISKIFLWIPYLLMFWRWRSLQSCYSRISKILRTTLWTILLLVSFLNLILLIEQSLSKSMFDVLYHPKYALVENKSLRHPNIDAQVAVAWCLRENMRTIESDLPLGNHTKGIFAWRMCWETLALN